MMTTTTRRATGILAVGLWLEIAGTLVFGLALLLAPGFVVETVAGGEAFDYGWVRWAGGTLLGITAGGWMVLRRPERQGAFVSAAGIAGGLAGLGLLLSLSLGEYRGPMWLFWVSLAASLGVGLVLLYARGSAREVLG